MQAHSRYLIMFAYSERSSAFMLSWYSGSPSRPYSSVIHIDNDLIHIQNELGGQPDRKIQAQESTQMLSIWMQTLPPVGSMDMTDESRVSLQIKLKPRTSITVG